jgi:hypothetical protein
MYSIFVINVPYVSYNIILVENMYHISYHLPFYTGIHVIGYTVGQYLVQLGILNSEFNAGKCLPLTAVQNLMALQYVLIFSTLP